MKLSITCWGIVQLQGNFLGKGLTSSFWKKSQICVSCMKHLNCFSSIYLIFLLRIVSKTFSPKEFLIILKTFPNEPLFSRGKLLCLTVKTTY